MARPIFSDPRTKLAITRDPHGVACVEAQTTTDLYYGVGYAHAHDRGLQLLLMRIIGRGCAAEYLDGTDELIAVDEFFRRANWRSTESEEAQLSSASRAVCLAYCEGVNARLAVGLPWECRLLRYKPDPWSVADCILLARMIGYLTLAQSQGEVERLIIQMVQAGVSRIELEELFPGTLEGFDQSLLEELTLGDHIVPPSIAWGMPALVASNNWVVSGTKTQSGAAMLANDPHLEINRLPAVFYEMALRLPDRYGLGAMMPGVPGLAVGRTPDLAWGATYSFMDCVDSWIEDCKDGSFRRGETWYPFTVRREEIRVKGGRPRELIIYENEHGVLDGDPHEPGKYLATRWSGAQAGAGTMEGVLGLWDIETVEEGMAQIGKVELAMSWVLADRSGSIGFQMSGLAPIRREGMSGLLPLPGWDERNDWNGFEAPQHLPRCLNPSSGFFATANQDLNEYGRGRPINACQGSYRAERIAEILGPSEQLSPADMYEMHQDVHSRQAVAFMDIARPLLPSTGQGRVLGDWDCRYTVESRGAFLFERFYSELLDSVFGRRLGSDVFAFLREESGILGRFHGELRPGPARRVVCMVWRPNARTDLLGGIGERARL